MKLSELGEFGLIRRIASLFQDQLHEFAHQVVGIGDDCAVIGLDDRESLLVTTDLLVEDVHFQLNRISPDDLGYKSLAINLSDIAAMGGSPLGAFLSLGLPENLDVAWTDAFFAGLAELAEAVRCPLLGGDTSRSPKAVVINVAIVGKMKTDHIKYRHNALAGDLLVVTGQLGDSAAGLRIILDEIDYRGDQDMIRLVEKHHRPRPHLDQGRWLASRTGVHAMLDISDGVASDITRLMEQSHVGACVDLGRLPLSAPLQRVGEKRGWDVPLIAACGGEDYCLLLTVAEDQFPSLAEAYRQRFGQEPHPIGSVTAEDGILTYRLHGRPVQLTDCGFNHFRPRAVSSTVGPDHGS